MSVGSTAVSAAYDSPAPSHHSASSPKQIGDNDAMEETAATEETEDRDATLKEERDNESSSPSSNSELGPVQDAPEDLSVKKTRPNTPQSRSSSSPGSQGSGSSGEATRPKRIKPIPPPLDLNARTLSPSDTLPQALPRSPGDLPRECLPIRKRHIINVKEEDGLRYSTTSSPSSAGLHPSATSPSLSSLLFSSSLALTPSSLSLTPSSAGLAAFTQFPVPPPPLIPIPGLPSGYPKSPFLASAAANGFPTPPTDLHSPAYPWAISPTLTAMGLLPTFSPLPTSPLQSFAQNSSTLLSPSPSSYHSSSNSSREDLLPSSHPHQSKLTVPTPRYGPIPSLNRGKSPGTPSSPGQQSPLMRSHGVAWPMPVWQCFMPGTQVRFLLPGTDTPWQKAEELGKKDKIALEADAQNPYQYAPNGLVLLEYDLNQSEANITIESKPVLRVMMRPHNVPDVSSVEMVAECPLDHPFFVKDKGWCSYRSRQTYDKYGIPCQDLCKGDICLPPNHPDAVRTPDLSDRFKKFEFSSHDLADQLSPSLGGPRQMLTSANSNTPLRHNIASILSSAAVRNSAMSPPMSPAKKKSSADPDKPKRPMNGFMLFAKKYRLELIQQHPGKDNRAISVLLGEAWKNLPLEEREKYSQKAKVLADEQKKLHPDCWKRKRSLSTANSGPPPPTTQSASQSPVTPNPPTSLHSMPGTPTSHMSFLLPPHPSYHMQLSALNAASNILSQTAVPINPS